jgi:glutathione synthase/RimK-type ligase-like ATP-grasp enzyme
MILILSGAGDIHADEVTEALTARGVQVVRFDPADFPSAASMWLQFEHDGTLDGELRLPTRSVGISPEPELTVVRLADIEAVWLRRPGKPLAHQKLSGTTAGDFVAHEAAATLADLWELLGVPFVPATPDQVAHAGHKARQLRIAGRLGFELPASLITNDPDQFLRFHRREQSVITKRIGTGQRLAAGDGETIVRYADPVRPRDLVAIADIELCPFITQSEVAKNVELRVTVVGERVFAAAIHSQEAHHTRSDWRRYDSAHTPMQPIDLPEIVSGRCRDLVRELDLLYGAIDLVLTPDGRYVFLEINPNGQYLWIEHDTGLPITEAIADLLASMSKDGKVGNNLERVG